ncbi:response regulator [Jhaorihella thermophila]|uniref:DNA-binding response regulator, NarL/FixJ family, contains REC and HTH domains n=1 Tax=Jhaorihella thermophila TaxID=488547 RepID=A0A1H5RZV9_9RHOB|nr:response regulator transcription factor [Jhaorihella thermophila]SEF43869.1 DNA-binding response regulator, NarL/FixJ family, contains REC and HTH domains [Jhaorihella thermophila]
MTQSGSDANGFQSALIVDDHPLFCDALSMTLQAITGIRRIETAACLADALDRMAGGSGPDLIVLDLNLPDVNGLDGLIRLRRATGAPIVVVSSMADNRIISSAIHAGANGFVPKHSQRDVFQQAIGALARGEQFIPAGHVLLDDTATAEQTDAAARLASLTAQQARILQLICEGKLNKQIAYDLSIAETTVKAHVTAIMRKLGVQSRTQAVLIAKESSFPNALQEGPPAT